MYLLCLMIINDQPAILSLSLRFSEGFIPPSHMLSQVYHMTAKPPAYVLNGVEYTYEPPQHLCSLRRYNVAQCARQRMQDAHHFYKNDPDGSFELWQRERVSFWSTLAHSIPDNFTR